MAKKKTAKKRKADKGYVVLAYGMKKPKRIKSKAALIRWKKKHKGKIIYVT